MISSVSKLLLASGALAAPHLYAIEHVEMDALSLVGESSVDVRAQYGSVVLAVSDPEVTPMALQSVDLGLYLPSDAREYSVVLRQKLGSEEPANLAQAWEGELKATLGDRIIYTAEDLIVTAMPVAELDVLETLPRGSESLSIPREPLVPRRKSFEFSAGMHEIMKGRNDTVTRIMDEVDYDSIMHYLTCLTGERAECSDIFSRQSASVPLVTALAYMEETFESFGFECEYHEYRSDWAPNLIARRAGTGSGGVRLVMGAHADSRNTNSNDSTGRAPGANDDGSGSAILMELARVIHTLDVQFPYDLELQAYTGEEQGLVGSRALARKYSDEGVEIVAQLQTDMVAYFDPNGNGAPTLGLPNRFVSEPLRLAVQDIMHEFTPTVETGATSVCCSDQQAFHENGYEAIMFFDDASGRILDPMYHRAGDLVDRAGFGEVNGGKQYEMVGRAVAASMAVIGEAYISSEE